MDKNNARKHKAGRTMHSRITCTNTSELLTLMQERPNIEQWLTMPYTEEEVSSVLNNLIIKSSGADGITWGGIRSIRRYCD